MGSNVRSILLQQFSGYLSTDDSARYYIDDLTWQVKQGEHWVLLGGNGAGKSALAAALIGEAKQQSGQRHSTFNKLQLVSSDLQKQLLNTHRKSEKPQKVTDMLFAEPQINSDLCQQLITAFNFDALLNRDFTDLSTGETRKLLLIKALSANSDLVVLDEPFDGLDSESVGQLNRLLQQLSAQTCFVFVLNRVDEIPAFVDHFAYVNNGRLQHSLAKPCAAKRADLFKLLHLEHTSLSIPDAPERCFKSATNTPLVKLTNAHVRYSEQTIFENLNWTINQYQHWQLTGKNGSGKTCLLNLITGDNPQCYNNEIEVFGFKRGTGESIWDIKQHIGYISNTLHLQYRVSISALNTIISGFFDSIGLYQQASELQTRLAKEWLALIGLSDKTNSAFTQLSYGDQRLLLIVRAMVKHPALLILDEPCLGLDEANRQRVLLLIEKVCAAKTSTVIYVNHHAADTIKGIEHTLKMEDFKPAHYGQHAAHSETLM